MAKLLRGSVIFRVLCILYRWLWTQISESCIFGYIAAFWPESGVRKLFVSGGERTLRTSVLYAAAARGNARLASAHGFGAYVRGSLLYRIPAAIFRAGRESFFVGRLFADGPAGLALTLLGFYAGLDWVLRDVLSVPVISSLWDELLLAACLVWIIWHRMDRTDAEAPRLNPMDLPVAVFPWVALCLLILVCPYPSINVSGYRAACQYVLWFFIVTRLIRSDRDFKRLYAALVIFAGLIALHGIYQFIVAAPIPEHWTDQAEQSVRTRVYSIFGSPNIMADYMVLFAPMAAGLAYYAKDKKLKYAAWFATFCMCFSCLFTMSRGGWVAMAVTILIFALLVDRRLVVLMLAAAVVALMLPFVASRIGYLFTDSFAESTARGGRAGRWAIGLKLLEEANPFFGVGHGIFGGAIAMQNQVNPRWSYFYLDNYYIKTLVEMGYLGLGAFITTLVGWLLTATRCLKRCFDNAEGKQAGMYPLCAGIFAGQCGVLVHCYFENIFEEPYMQAYFWILSAMLVYLGFLRNRKTSK